MRARQVSQDARHQGPETEPEQGSSVLDVLHRENPEDDCKPHDGKQHTTQTEMHFVLSHADGSLTNDL